MNRQDAIRERLGDLINEHRMDWRKIQSAMKLSFSTVYGFMGGKKVHNDTLDTIEQFLNTFTQRDAQIYRRR